MLIFPPIASKFKLELETFVKEDSLPILVESFWVQVGRMVLLAAEYGGWSSTAVSS